MSPFTRRRFLKLASVFLASLVARRRRPGAPADSAGEYKLYLPLVGKERGEDEFYLPLVVKGRRKRRAYGLRPGDRGHAAGDVLHKCVRSPTGGPWYPNDLRTVWNDAGSEIDYDTWAANLAAAGVNLVWMRMGGRNRDSGQVCSFEPPPYGTFSIFHSDLSSYLPGDLATYRSDQVTYPPPAGFWNASNVKALIDAFESHGIKAWIYLFAFTEFGSDWAYHAWNANNRYVDGARCKAQDRGFLTDAREFFTDATAIAQAKARVQMAMDLFGDRDVVAAWSLFEEIPWCMVPSFWGEPGWNAATRDNIRTKTIPWVQEMAQYIKANDPHGRPVSLSHARTDLSGSWSANSDNFWNVMDKPFQVADLDIVEYNFYEEGDVDKCIAHLKMLQEKHHPKILWCTQYWPFDGGLADVEEVAPFLDSREHQWIAACGSQWTPGPLRWPGIKRVATQWQTGGYADSDLHAIGGVTATFASHVDWDDWRGPGRNWDANVHAAGVERTISWGDGRHVTFYVDFAAAGTKTVTVDNLEAGSYHLYIFNWVDGTLDSRQVLAATPTLSFDVDVGGFARHVLVGYLVRRT